MTWKKNTGLELIEYFSTYYQRHIHVFEFDEHHLTEGKAHIVLAQSAIEVQLVAVIYKQIIK